MGNKPTCIDGGMFGGSLPLAFLLKKPQAGATALPGAFPVWPGVSQTYSASFLTAAMAASTLSLIHISEPTRP